MILAEFALRFDRFHSPGPLPPSPGELPKPTASTGDLDPPEKALLRWSKSPNALIRPTRARSGASTQAGSILYGSKGIADELTASGEPATNAVLGKPVGRHHSRHQSAAPYQTNRAPHITMELTLIDGFSSKLRTTRVMVPNGVIINFL